MPIPTFSNLATILARPTDLLARLFPDPAYRHNYSLWASPDARYLRYRLLHDLYSGAIYSGFLGEAVRRNLGLYRNARPALNPIRRIIDFHVAHTLAGPLDADAGNGKATPSALPIVTPRTTSKETAERVAGAVATLWRSSQATHWRTLLPFYGSLYGDFGLELAIDHSRGQVRLRPVDPFELAEPPIRDTDGTLLAVVLEREIEVPADLGAGVADGSRVGVTAGGNPVGRGLATGASLGRAAAEALGASRGVGATGTAISGTPAATSLGRITPHVFNETTDATTLSQLYPRRYGSATGGVGSAATGPTLGIYREAITLASDGGSILYQTFLNGQPYQFPGSPGSEWSVGIPFIPVFLGQHINEGHPWGISEIAAAVWKATEVDNQTSMTADAVSRMVNGPWLLKGAKVPQGDMSARGGSMSAGAGGSSPMGGGGSAPYNNTSTYADQGMSAGASRPVDSAWGVNNVRLNDRATMPIFEVQNKDASMEPLVFPLAVDKVDMFIDRLETAASKDYPELNTDLANTSGSGSGRALRVARQPATGKIQARREEYDRCIVEAQTAAIAIGGMLGFAGYEGFGIDSVGRGQWGVDGDGSAVHWIGSRPVFADDPLDTIEIQKARADMALVLVQCGVTEEGALDGAGFAKEDIDRWIEMGKKAAADAAAEQAKADAAQQGGGSDASGDATDGSDGETATANQDAEGESDQPDGAEPTP